MVILIKIVKGSCLTEFMLHWLNKYRKMIGTFLLIKQISAISYGAI